MDHGGTFAISTMVGLGQLELSCELAVGTCQLLVEAELSERDGPMRSWDPHYGFLSYV